MNEQVDKSSLHTAVESIAGKSVIVTGGTTGIGRAIAGLLVSNGANVFVFGRHGKELQDTLEAFRGLAGGKIEGIVADVAKPRDIDKVFDAARQHFETVDILVDNAGLAGEGVADMDDEEWRYVMETNLLGAMACASRGLQWMSENKRGHIVIIGSMSAERKGKGSSVYVAAKSGLRGFAESFHREATEKGVKVTLIEPGEVGSDMQESSPASQRRQIRKGEMLRAEDIAVGVHYAVTQPDRCAVTFMQIRPKVEDLP